MNISAPFIARPVATFLLMLALLAAGAAGYNLLPVAAMPEVEFPTLSVTANLPGADPETMASSVAQPLERQFASVPGINELTSTSSLGFTQITLQFDLSRNIDGAASDVQAAINAAQGNLPRNLPTPPTYRKVNPADRPVIIFGLTSKVEPLTSVDRYADLGVVRGVSIMSGVGQALIFGQQKFAPTIRVNPAALAARGIGLDEVATAIAGSSAQLPMGTLQGPQQSFAIGANSQLFTPAELGKVIVAYRNGAPVRLSDVAQIVIGPESALQASWVGTQRGEMVGVWREPGANTIELVDRIKGQLPQFRAGIPRGVELSVISDRTLSIRESFRDVELTLVAAVVLVVAVIFLFLRNSAATAIPSVTAPLSLVGTFGVMYVLGYTLDNLSLMGLTLAVGLVVDDAIVMVENVYRYLEQGKTRLEAALEGAAEMGFTIVSITLSLIAVFIPVLFMSGVVGRLFREFGVVVSVAVGLSAFIAVTLSPMMASLILNDPKTARHGRLYALMERGFDSVASAYRRGLNFSLRHQGPVFLFNLALIALAAWMFYAMPKGFFPQEDTGLIFGFTKADQDVSFKAMTERQNAVGAIIEKDPDVEAFGSFVGGSGGAGLNTGRFFIQLKPLSERTARADDIIRRLRPKVNSIPGITTFMQSIQNIQIGARLEATQYQYTLQDTDLNELNQWAPRILAALKKESILRDLTSDQQTGGQQLMINIDRDAAARLGVNVTAIQQTLYDAFGQPYVTQLYSATDTYHVVLEVASQYQTDVAGLSRIYVRGAGGKLIPVSQFATLERKETPITVNHQGQIPSVTLSFNLAPGVSLGEAVRAVNAAVGRIGKPETVGGSFQGVAREFQLSLSTQPMLIAAALFAVYIVLGMLYESFIHPVTILLTLPSATVGALAFLWGFGFDLTMIAIIGLLMLIGIVKKNGIMLVDFAVERVRAGMPPREAVEEAALLRFRPILMTTMAAVFVTLPIAIGIGAGADLRQPLGVAVVGGLLVSQLLTLFTTPVTYLYMERLRQAAGIR